jgi:hypothetical protein
VGGGGSKSALFKAAVQSQAQGRKDGQQDEKGEVNSEDGV